MNFPAHKDTVSWDVARVIWSDVTTNHHTQNVSPPALQDGQPGDKTDKYWPGAWQYKNPVSFRAGWVR